jgi:hypothetical protein
MEYNAKKKKKRKKENVGGWRLTDGVRLSIMHNVNNDNLCTFKTSYSSKHLIQKNVGEKIILFGPSWIMRI